MAVVGFWTLLKVTVCELEGVEALPFLLRRRLPAVAVLTVQPAASPRLTGWLIVDELLSKPVGVTQAPEGASQAVAEKDLTMVPVVGTVKVNV